MDRQTSKAQIKNSIAVYEATIESIIQSYLSHRLDDISLENLDEVRSFLYTLEKWINEPSHQERKSSYIKILRQMKLEINQTRALVIGLQQEPKETNRDASNHSYLRLEQILKSLRKLQSILTRLDKEV